MRFPGCLLLQALAARAQVAIPDAILRYAGETVPVLVQLQAPTQVIEQVHSAQFATSDAKACGLVARLQAFAKESQASLVSYLDELKASGLVEAYRSYYISNTLAVEATKSAIVKIAHFSTVRSIGCNFMAQALHRRAEPEFSEYGTDVIPDLSRAPLFPGPGLRQMEADEIDIAIVKAAGKLVFGNLDSGADFMHPALVDSYMGNKSSHFNHSFSWFDFAQRSPAPTDTLGHGTGVISLAVGKSPVGISP